MLLLRDAPISLLPIIEISNTDYEAYYLEICSVKMFISETNTYTVLLQNQEHILLLILTVMKLAVECTEWMSNKLTNFLAVSK